jgi:hypothetical protein
VILNATALFDHANIDLPRPVDRVLRLIVVIEQFRTRCDLWLDRMLIQPVRGRHLATRSIRASP